MDTILGFYLNGVEYGRKVPMDTNVNISNQKLSLLFPIDLAGIGKIGPALWLTSHGFNGYHSFFSCCYVRIVEKPVYDGSAFYALHLWTHPSWCRRMRRLVTLRLQPRTRVRLILVLSLLLYHQSKTPACETVPPTFTVSLLSAGKPF